jgi:hypothetical protein
MMLVKRLFFYNIILFLQCLEDVNLFANSNYPKLKALQRLFFTIYYAQNAVAPFFDKILRSLVRFQRDEDKDIAFQVTLIAEIFGVFIDAGVYLPTILSQINELEVTNTRTLVAYLTFLASMIRFEVPKEIDYHLPSILKTLETIENNFK